MSKKDIIFRLREDGNSYREITKLTGFSSGLVSYYLGSGQKEKNLKRSRDRRRKISEELKISCGGKCKSCGYDRCLNALDFHHADPKEKSFEISAAIRGKENKTIKEIREEVQKCVLICSNCHRELHSGALIAEFS